MSIKLRAASVSVAVNISLLIAKFFVALITGSIGIFAEAIHSLFDLFASFLAYLGIKKAEEPEDHTHHHGHEKFETLSSLLQSLLILLTAGFISFEAYKKFIHPEPIQNTGIGVIMILISIICAYLTSKYLSKIAKEEGGSQALEADSAHFTTDILGSVAVLIGLILSLFGFSIGDPLAAFAVSIIMVYISLELIYDSFKVFMDYPPDKKIVSNIKRIISSEKRIRSFHKFRARMAGSKFIIQFHIQVNGKMTVNSAHAIATDIETAIRKKYPCAKTITIHIEP